jgi:RNA ligase
MTCALKGLLMTAIALADLFDPAALAAAIADGYVRRQDHPTEPLAILNYTEKAAYEGAWNPVTSACRGLIFRPASGEVVARPFRKFFNYGQPGSVVMPLDAPVSVTDKADGSLGILYPLPSGGYAVATRGSFASDQAVHATGLWRDRYAHRFTPQPAVTYLVEIVFPANRIVVDYGELDDLILLGAVDNATGLDVSADWPGPRITQFPCATLGEALAAPPRPNAEGLVVRLLGSDERVKVKQPDYVALRRIVTGLTARTVWEHLLSGAPLADLITPLPDEFHGWVRRVADGILLDVDTTAGEIAKAYQEIVDNLPAGWVRKDFAAAAVAHPLRWALFALLDGRDLGPELLKRARPDPFVTPSGRTFTEDNA